MHPRASTYGPQTPETECASETVNLPACRTARATSPRPILYDRQQREHCGTFEAACLQVRPLYQPTHAQALVLATNHSPDSAGIPAELVDVVRSWPGPGRIFVQFGPKLARCVPVVAARRVISLLVMYDLSDGAWVQGRRSQAKREQRRAETRRAGAKFAPHSTPGPRCFPPPACFLVCARRASATAGVGNQ